MFAPKLKQGDKVCVIAPARSMGLISDEVKNTAIENLRQLGLETVFDEHCWETDDVYSSSVESRLNDLHAANFDFGHTTPIACLPIGEKAILSVFDGMVTLKITRH